MRSPTRSRGSALHRPSRRRNPGGPPQTPRPGYGSRGFVEIRAAGKRSAVTMSTPTSTNGLAEDEGGEAISSTYRRQQRRPTPRAGPSPAKPTPPRPRTTPPNQPLPRGNNPPPPGAQVQGPDPHPTTVAYVSTADSLDTASRNVRPTAVSTALPLAQPAPLAAEPTTTPSCAGRRLNTRVRYQNN